MMKVTSRYLNKNINGVECMGERFELSFKNKEVRMWCYIIGPTVVAGVLIPLMGGIEYQYVQISLSLPALIAFYVWRFLYRRKQKKEMNSSKNS